MANGMTTTNAAHHDNDRDLKAFSWSHVFRLWSLATLPMILLTWVVTPWIIARSRMPAALVFFFCSSLGMVGLGVIAWLALRHERTSWTGEALRRRLWLTTPSHPKTTRAYRRPYLWLVPFVLVAAISLLVSHGVFAATMMFHFLRDEATSRFFPGHSKTLGLMSPELAGQWWLLFVIPFVGWLTIVAGEELFFRGLLLPRMPSRVGWLTNSLLSSLHYLYIPWMIPGRLLATLGANWAARRYCSNWIPLLVRSIEVIGLTLATLVGVTSFTFPPVTTPLATPHLDTGATARSVKTRPLAALPACDRENPFWSVDLRAKDVSSLDLRDRARDLECAAFDTHTLWPAADRLPTGFEPARILEINRNPGLGLHALHAQGVTGRGVGIGIMDMPLVVNHQEYASRLRWYEDMTRASSARPPYAHMHGPAVSSIAVGRTVGVAPEADLYYIAVPFDTPRGFLLMPHHFAQAIRRLVEINRSLPAGRKIRAISLSQGWGDAALGYHNAEAAVALARAEGIVFFSVNRNFEYGGLSRPNRSDPDSFADYASAWLWKDDRNGAITRTKLFSIPIDNRTLAVESTPDSMAYFPTGGYSWGPPFMAGVYALAAQVDPTITPERFFTLAMRHARKHSYAAPERRMASLILDPAALIGALQSGDTYVNSSRAGE